MPAVHPDRSDEGLAPPDPRPNWYLTGRLAGEMEVQSFAISPFPFRVGRRPGLSLTLPRHTVSGLHAEFDTRGTQLLVRDLGSTNGTLLNNYRLPPDLPYPLHNGDEIRFGRLLVHVFFET